MSKGIKRWFAAEYGVLPNQSGSITAALTALLSEIGDDSEIVFECGTYRFDIAQAATRKYAISNTFPTEQQAVSLLLENKRRVTLDFGGSTLLFNGWQIPIAVDNCTDIIIKNAAIDWMTPTAAEARVLAADENEITLHIDSERFPHTVDDGVLYFLGDGFKNEYWASMEYDRETLQVRGASADRILNATFTAVDESTVVMHGTFAVPPLVGNYLAMRHGKRTQAGIFCQASSHLRFEHIRLHNTCGIGMVCQFCDTVTISQSDVLPNMKKGRLVTSSHDDALQFSGCRGQVTIDNCRFRGMFDDAVNVHGTSTVITAIDGALVRGRFAESCSAGFAMYAKAGDVFSFMDRSTMDPYTRATVVSFSLTSREEFEITFTEPLPDTVRVGDAMENISSTPRVLIENCYVGSARARGVLVATPRPVLIRNNVFDTSGSAILMSGDANGWFESGACLDVSICDNEFTAHCLSGEYQFGDGIISLSPVVERPENSRGFHRHIAVCRNRFTVADSRVLYAFCVNDLTFAENTVIRVPTVEGEQPCYTRYEYCTDVTECDNRFFDILQERN